MAELVVDGHIKVKTIICDVVEPVHLGYLYVLAVDWLLLHLLLRHLRLLHEGVHVRHWLHHYWGRLALDWLYLLLLLELWRKYHQLALGKRGSVLILKVVEKDFLEFLRVALEVAKERYTLDQMVQIGVFSQNHFEQFVARSFDRKLNEDGLSILQRQINPLHLLRQFVYFMDYFFVLNLRGRLYLRYLLFLHLLLGLARGHVLLTPGPLHRHRLFLLLYYR